MTLAIMVVVQFRRFITGKGNVERNSTRIIPN